MGSVRRRHAVAGPTLGGVDLNLASIVVLLAVAAEVWLLAFVTIRGRRRWLQATYAACALAYIVGGAIFVAANEAIVSRVPDSLALGVLLLAHALTAILVLGLIHGEGLPRERTAAFLVLVPVPVLAFLAPSQGWTLANAFGANVLGAFLVLCLGLALAESIYARSVSSMYAPHAFWIAVGVVALIVGGPIYAFELLILGLTPLAGANVAAPVALASFARVALRTDPYPIAPRPPRIRPARGSIQVSDAIVFDEVRPKYALRAAHDEASARPTLVLGRRTSGMATTGASLATIEPGRHAAERALATASEFLALSPGGLVVCEDLAALAALSGWRSVKEAIVRLRHLARGTRSTVVLCTSRLTKAERKDLSALDLPTWSLPDPTTEIVALLGRSFGGGGARLVESFSRAQGIRLEDLTTDHVPALLAFVSRALEELSEVESAPAGHGLRVQFDVAASVLRAFALQGPADLVRGKWPSRVAVDRDAEYLITAADYWKGKEAEELFAAADAIVDREPLFEKARSVFIEQLGEAGEGVLRTQLARLGKKPEDLDRRDLVRIADRASVDLESVAEVLDIAAEKDRIHRQIESIRQRLELIAEDQE